jgi:hypothetical protein
VSSAVGRPVVPFKLTIPRAAWLTRVVQSVDVDPYDVIAAHKRSSCHRSELLASTSCGCFYCLAIFLPSAICDWTDEGETALCPECGIDSVIGDASGYAVDKEMLGRMKKHWF